jgi:peptide/nickel transport system substrate-binding protein
MTDNNNVSRRRFLEATGGTASALALAGCTGSDGDTEDTTTTTTDSTETTTENTTEQMEQSGTYRLVGATATTFDPIKATDTASGGVIQNVFDALTNYPNGTTATELLLAKDYEVASDDVTYTFTLKEGVTYNNGDEVTAQDFVYAFERLAGSPNSRRSSFILGDLAVKHETKTVTTTNDEGEEVEKEEYVPDSLAVEATGDYSLKMELSQPFHASLSMLAYTSFSAVPDGIVGDPTKDDGGDMTHKEFATKNPVGAGPFTLEKWEKSTERLLSARSMDEYHGEGPYVEEVHHQVIEKTNPTYTYATTNMNADHPSVPSSKYDSSKITIDGTDDRGRKYGEYGPLENGLTADYYRVQELSTYYFGFNCDNVEKAARQAFAYAYNQQEVVDQVYKGRFEEAFFFTPPAIFPGGATNYNDMAKNYPYGYNEQQLGEAKSVMEDAGYSDSNKYELTLTTYESSTMKEIGQLMQDKLGAAHIDLKYEQAPFSTLLTRASNGDLEAYSLGWIADYPAPDNFLKLLNPEYTQTDNPDATSSFDWDGTAAAEKATKGWEKVQNNPTPTDSDKSARNEGYLDIEKANWEDMPMLTIFHGVAEHMDYKWLDKPRVGAMGSSRQKSNTVKIGNRDEYK